MRPRRVDLGDLSHLTPEDAELYAALYAERNQLNPTTVRPPQRQRPRPQRKRTAA